MLQKRLATKKWNKNPEILDSFRTIKLKPDEIIFAAMKRGGTMLISI